MSFWSELKFWVIDTFKSRSSSVEGRDTLSRALRDATHTRGDRGGIAVSGSEELLEQVFEGHEDYHKSFEKNQEESD